MIRATSGAELCASHNNLHPSPVDCAEAVDRTYQGDVDLSDRVVVGEPVQKSALHWVVPYNVKDDAGNEATTVWRDVVVQEVDLVSVESKIRAQVMREQQAEQKLAIQKAVRDEKAKWEKEQAATAASTNSRNNRRTTGSDKTCPACSSCDCPKTPNVNRESCQAYCENVSRSCTLSDESWLYGILFSMEEIFPPWIVPLVAMVFVTTVVMLVLRWIVAFVFNPRAYQSYDYENSGTSNDDMLLRSPQPVPSPAPPSSTRNNNNQNASFFSPGSQAGLQSPNPVSNGTPRNRQAESIYDESIYMSPPLIAPSKTGDGVRKRNPYT
jgi:hypothetical protein